MNIDMYVREMEEYNKDRKGHMDQIAAYLAAHGVSRVDRESFKGVVWNMSTSGSVSAYYAAPDDEDDWWSNITTGEWCSRLCVVEGKLYQFGRWRQPMVLPDGFIYEN